MSPEFKPFPKIPRYTRECLITEKIDGTNACIFIDKDKQPITLDDGRVFPFLCGKRSSWCFPDKDNYGFAAWAYENAEALLQLGPGTHFGEWWGAGIQRRYGMSEKRFSLFNCGRWTAETVPSCVRVVPILYKGEFCEAAINGAIQQLREEGSHAALAEGVKFDKPEGIVCYHFASGTLFKKTLENDRQPKGVTE